VVYKRGEVEYGEDFKVGEVSELGTTEGWAHRWSMILKTGGVVHR
jgi:hypothetical protein